MEISKTFCIFVSNIKIMYEGNNELDEPWFEINVLDSDQHPAGFMTWTQGITQDNYTVILPDKSTVDVRLFRDLQKVYNEGDYTTYLLHRYQELQ